jgi:Ca2+-binding RTX toxin-like protein
MLINWLVLAPTLYGVQVPTYGNYGGPGYSNGQLIPPGSPAFSAEPLDALDALFLSHDRVYYSSSDPNVRAQADLALLRGIAALPDSSLSVEGHLYAGAATLALLANIALVHQRPDLLNPAEVTLLVADAADNLRKGGVDPDPAEVAGLVAWFEDVSTLLAAQAPALDAFEPYLALTGFFNPLGTSDDDVFLGLAGNDAVLALAGEDFAFGGAGADNLNGGSGDDTVAGGAGNDRLSGGDGDDQLIGGTGDDRLDGGAGRDALSGLDGNDTLFGRTGNDRLSGGNGDDVLVGGSGREFLRGGDGDDDFVFHARGHSGAGGSGRDVITDFEHGDTIDLSTLDANTTVAGNQRFAFVADFTGAAGELQWDRTSSGFLVSADVDGDAVADFSIHVRTSVERLFSFDFDL